MILLLSFSLYAGFFESLGHVREAVPGCYHPGGTAVARLDVQIRPSCEKVLDHIETASLTCHIEWRLHLHAVVLDVHTLCEEPRNHVHISRSFARLRADNKMADGGVTEALGGLTLDGESPEQTIQRLQAELRRKDEKLERARAALEEVERRVEQRAEAAEQRAEAAERAVAAAVAAAEAAAVETYERRLKVVAKEARFRAMTVPTTTQCGEYMESMGEPVSLADIVATLPEQGDGFCRLCV